MTPERRAAKSAYERERRAADPERRRKHAEYMKRWRAANPEAAAAIDRKSKTLHADAKASRDKSYYQRNTASRKKQAREWAQRNPEKRAAMRATRRARAVQSGGRITAARIEALFQLQRGKCACCGASLAGGYQVDHIMPLALGGSNSDDNIQLLRPACNNLKRAKHPVDFMQADRGMLL